MRRSAVIWLAVVAVSALVGHAFGYVFGVANQTTYFLQALHRAHPELLNHDWLVTNTREYHSLFGIVAGLLFRLDDSGGTVFGVVDVILMAALLSGVFFVIRGVTKSYALAIFLLIAGWLTVNGQHSVAGSYLWSGYFQPSLIGAVGWVIALGMYVRGRPLATGIALAVGGVFHANFLILGIGMFALAELVIEREGRLRRLALLLAPQLVALAILMPEILAHAGGRDPKRALWVLVQFHAPLHYKPSWIVRTLPNLVRWAALAIVVAPIASELGDRVTIRCLVWWSAVATGLCAVGTAAMMIPAFLPLTRLYVWRLAPFAILAAQIVIAIAAAASITDIRRWKSHPIWRPVTAALLLVWIAVDKPFLTPADATWCVWIVIAAIAIGWLSPTRLRAVALSLAAAATLAAPLWYRVHWMLDPQFVVAPEGPDTDGLYAWARTSTPNDAVFMIPPDLYRFRLVSRRAVYADFKSPPLDENGLLEWHDRLCKMTGALPTDKIPTHRKRWVEASGDALVARAKELGVDYLVLDRSQAHDAIAAQPIFSNAAFNVFAVR